MLLSSLTLLFLPITTALASQARCLPSGDERAINEAFLKGGRQAIVSLCPSSVHRLTSPIHFTAPSQTLTTEGDPTGSERAYIIVEGPEQAVAVHADCPECSWATIRSVEVDGNRPQLLRIPKGQAMLQLGNGEGQVVRDCRLYEPRGWSAVHFREGDRMHCRKGHVHDNVIGPCGEEWDEDYDRPENDGKKQRAPWGGPEADGLSISCKDSLVERNIVFDTTDGGIVLFGASGTEVRENVIYSKARVVLGGINLVDYFPWAGDYTGVNVHHNNISALAGYLKTAISVGFGSWSDDTTITNRGGTITDNVFRGEYWGYGMVVSQAEDFTVLRNTFEGNVKFDGVPTRRCPKAPVNAKPMPFLIHKGSSKGMFQEDFVNGEVQHIICVNPPDVAGKPYKPFRYRDSPLRASILAAREAEANPGGIKHDLSGYDGPLTDALVKYQMTLMGALGTVSERIEGTGADRGDVLHGELPGSGDLTVKLETLESGEKKLQSEFEGLVSELEGFTTKLKLDASNRLVLQAISRSVDPPSPRVRQGRMKEKKEQTSAGLSGVSLTPLGILAASGGVIMAGLVVIRRWRDGKGVSKKGMKLV